MWKQLSVFVVEKKNPKLWNQNQNLMSIAFIECALSARDGDKSFTCVVISTMLT